MSTNSRTDRATQAKSSIGDKQDDATRVHTSAIQAMDYAKVVELKAAGKSCRDCSQTTRISAFFMSCKLKANKPIKPYNICPHWTALRF